MNYVIGIRVPVDFMFEVQDLDSIHEARAKAEERRDEIERKLDSMFPEGLPVTTNTAELPLIGTIDRPEVMAIKPKV